MCLTGENVDVCVGKFYDLLDNIIEQNVPLVGTPSSRYPPWYSSELKSLINAKRLAYANWKSSRLVTDYIRFKEMRARCIRLSRSTYKNFVTRAELNIKRNAKSFWSFINKLRSVNSIPPNMHLSGTHVSDSESIVNLLAHYFGSVYNTNPLEDIVISVEELHKVVCEREANTNPGPDGIPAYFVKEYWASL